MSDVTTEMQQEIINYFTSRNWQRYDDIRYDHLNADERAILETAVSTCKEFNEQLKAGETPSLLLIASGVKDDSIRTGYGCGKTMLAKAIHYQNSHTIAPENGKLEHIKQNGTFYAARDLMAIFDDVKDLSQLRYKLGQLRRTIIIDDLGREGTLRWERRDPNIQLAEKQDRYYSIINYCYENDIGVVITSNLSSREMATFLGGATWSRLLEMVPKKYRINMTGIRDMRPMLADDGEF